MVETPVATFGSAPPMRQPEDPGFYDLLVDSYRRIVGAEPPFLPPGALHSARWLYTESPVCVLAHDADPDPRFIYANKAAQACFEYSFDEITALPSRLSAEAPARDERQRLLDAVARDGFATGYSGVRIAKSGRRFLIEDGVLWHLTERDGSLHGVAATFARWRNA
jgi:PAS domain-containing protein